MTLLVLCTLDKEFQLSNVAYACNPNTGETIDNGTQKVNSRLYSETLSQERNSYTNG